MSDLTTEVLDELEMLEKKAGVDGWATASYEQRRLYLNSLITLARALIAAARERDRFLAALIEARQFISNGIEFGYIAKPQPGTREAKCLPIIEAALERKDGGQCSDQS